MAELVIFVALVALIAAAGISLGMLAAPRLGAWDERRAAGGDAARAEPGPRSADAVHPLKDGGDTGG
jgi:hypothetical protein